MASKFASKLACIYLPLFANNRSNRTVVIVLGHFLQTIEATTELLLLYWNI